MSDIAIALESPRQPDVLALIEALDGYHLARYPSEANHFLDIDALCAPEVRFFVARRGPAPPLGIGALWLKPADGMGEVKRMYVDPAARGLGLGRRMLARVEAEARAAGLARLVLETGTLNTEALALYERGGFVRRGPFGDYPDHPMSVFMEKLL